jgi:hypothetical protein
MKEGVYPFMAVDVDQIIKIRDKLIRDLEKEKTHKNNRDTQEVVDVFDYVIDELLERFYINDYE